MNKNSLWGGLNLKKGNWVSVAKNPDCQANLEMSCSRQNTLPSKGHFGSPVAGHFYHGQPGHYYSGGKLFRFGIKALRKPLRSAFSKT
jgi:hypothetical protein